MFSKALCPNCNVILVTLDTMGAKHMGLYGYDRPTTPFLDSFGKRSVVFDTAIAQGSFTPTSHTAILTGKYPAENRVYGTTDKLPEEAHTLAESMKASGYVTHAVSAAILIQPQYGWGQGFDGFDERWFIDTVTNNDAATTFSLATDWIKANKKKPFFLFINTNHLHSPHTPASEAVLDELGVLPPRKIVDERDIVGPHLDTQGITKEDAALMKDYYDGTVRELDGVVKGFVDMLDKEGLTKNTIVIFEGDHSEQFGEHGIVGWFGVYNEQIHVPLIVYIPGQKPMRVSPVVELRSLPSTIRDLVGLTPDTEFPAASLLPYFTGKPTEPTIALTMHAFTSTMNAGMLKALLGKAPSVWESMKDAPPPEVRKASDIPKEIWYSARSDHWHLIKNADATLELYRVDQDPEEKENLIDKWYTMSVDDRKDALAVFRKLGADIPASCGPYCPR
jgi:arylsulfatase A-like enzyme